MPKISPKKTVNLALQGGGAHGAYTWGVLDRILEEEDIIIEGVSGTSAGAINGAVMVSGYAQGGRLKAKESLEKLWFQVSEISSLTPMSSNFIDKFLFGWNLDNSPLYRVLDAMSHFVSPYDSNPLNINPMREVLNQVVDFKALRNYKEIKFFATATHVESGQARIFSGDEITTDAILASTCLPQVFQAIEINGEHYWDGGYMGNPAIWPLIYHTQSEDIILIQINPIHREGIPKQPIEIVNRMNEINFNASLIAEMRAIEFVSRLINEGKLDKKYYKDLKMHLIYTPEEWKSLNVSSKMNGNWEFLTYLKNVGREASDVWIHENKTSIGKKSTIDIREKFLCDAGMSEKALSKRKSKLKQKQD